MIPLAPVVAVGVRAAATIILSATFVREVEVTPADLHPGHRTTVWWDDACDCRRVEVVERIADPEAPMYNPATTVHAGFTVAEAPP